MPTFWKSSGVPGEEEDNHSCSGGAGSQGSVGQMRLPGSIGRGHVLWDLKHFMRKRQHVYNRGGVM